MKHKGRLQERKRGTNELQNRKQIINGDSQSFPINNYFTNKYVKPSNQRQRVAE